MKKAEEVIKKFVAEWIKSNWDIIDHKRTEITTSKTSTVDMALKDIQYAMWVLTEVMLWGCDKDRYHDLVVYEYDRDSRWYKVLKLGDDHVKWMWNHTTNKYEYELTNPKEKTIIYFE
jgi:hypothetical protein